jgi:hypothetical protein
MTYCQILLINNTFTPIGSIISKTIRTKERAKKDIVIKYFRINQTICPLGIICKNGIIGVMTP